MTLELGHEALAETHDLGVGLAVGIEIGAALTAAHGEGGEAVLEGLLEAQELHNGEVDVGSEAETALVRTDGGVELYAETAVYLDLAVTIDPGYTELDNTLGLDKALKQTGFLILGMLLDHGFEGTKNFLNGLNELRLVSVAGADLGDDFFNVSVHVWYPPLKNSWIDMGFAHHSYYNMPVGNVNIILKIYLLRREKSAPPRRPSAAPALLFPHAAPGPQFRLAFARSLC